MQSLRTRASGTGTTADLEQVATAIAAAARVCRSRQEQNGAWRADSDMGPACTAQVLVALAYAGHLSKEDARSGGEWLESQQLADGSFRGWPFATHGSLGASACAWAGLLAAGYDPRHAAVRSVAAWVFANGGVKELIAAITKGELAALYLALVGLVDPAELPRLPMAWSAWPSLLRSMHRRFHGGVALGALQMGVVVRRLRGEWGSGGRKRGRACDRDCRRTEAMMDQWQNSDGSVNGNALQTAFALVTWTALGISKEDGRIQAAVASLQDAKRKSADGNWFVTFEADVWTTALHLRALRTAGMKRSEDGFSKGLQYLLDAQSNQLQPLSNQPKVGAPRTGGWAFQKHNTTMVDSDDTGMVLGLLGASLRGAGDDPLDAALEARTQNAIRKGRSWLLAMQNDDGGWAAFCHGLPSKAPGAAMTSHPKLPRGLKSVVSMLRTPPAALSDPATEDVTARALYGLAVTGSSQDDPEVQAALAFLQRNQLRDGSFWGRWVVNYIPTTAYVLAAASVLGLSLSSEWLARAAGWLTSCQNSDGGWGETVDSYSSPELRGVGPSAPATTALVLGALCDMQLGRSRSAHRAAMYLLGSQRQDGSWSSEGHLATFVPPTSFYHYPGTVDYGPLESLALYRRSQTDNRGLSDATLDALQHRGDTAMDAVMTSLGPEDAHKTARLLKRLPTKGRWSLSLLPSELAAFLTQTSHLPVWANMEELDLASALARRATAALGTAYFFSALPHSYANAAGAKMLYRADSDLASATWQRLIATSNFVFTVLEPGAFTNTRAVRACQRVRMAHAWVRRVSGVDENGVIPVHQEASAGMLLELSVGSLAAMQRLGVRISRDEQEAWLHLWNVVGHLLGVSPKVLPDSLMEAQCLLLKIRERGERSSDEGRALAQALVKISKRYAVLLPGLGDFPVAAIRHLAGDACADNLGLPEAGVSRLLLESATSTLTRQAAWPMWTARAASGVGRSVMGAQSMLMTMSKPLSAKLQARRQ